jgi:hypothetical protein
VDTAERITAVREKLSLGRRLGAASESPSCRQCVHGPIENSGIGPCDHPVHWRLRYDPVTGKLKGRIDETSTSEARSENGLCGPEGLLFAPYSTPQKIIRWFANHDPILTGWTAIATLGALGTLAITVLGRW